MAIGEDLPQLERLLGDLIIKYEQYFIGLEKREPLKVLADVEKLARRYAGTPINNTMYKYRYNMLVARFSTYREHWNRILRLIEEGRYSRDRFIRDLRQRPNASESPSSEEVALQHQNVELDRIYHEYREACISCNLPLDKISRDLIAASINKNKPNLVSRLGTEDLFYRVVVENGKPKIKASHRK